MYAVNTYEEIVAQEKALNERHIVVFLFVRPSLPGAKEVIAEFDYLHVNSRRYCSIYAVGYSKSRGELKNPQEVAGVKGDIWYYSNAAFVDFKEKLKNRIKWKYGGEIELLILQSNPGLRDFLDFRNYLAIDVNEGIKKEYIDSFPKFMEALIDSSRSEICAADALSRMQRGKYDIRRILETALGEIKAVPAPVKKIVKDRLFFRTSRSYSDKIG